MICFRWQQQKYYFRFKRGFFLLSMVIISLCYCLGNWQLHRYHYKLSLLMAAQARQNASPLSLSLLLKTKKSISDLQFQPVAVSGHYLNEMTMFVQNRMNKGRVGFEVLTPLQIPGEQQLLIVNRGWVPEPRPIIDAVRGLQKIMGDLKFYNEYQFILGPNIGDAVYPLVMQKIDIVDISRWTHRDFYPFVLRLGEQEANGYIRSWPVTTVLPQRHMAYAVQWFALALVMLMVFFCFCWEKEKSA